MSAAKLALEFPHVCADYPHMSIATQIISRLGGTRPAARKLGIAAATVQGWRVSGVVPVRRIPQIIAAAARLDPPVTLRPDDFFDLPPVSSAPTQGTTPQQPSARL